MTKSNALNVISRVQAHEQGLRFFFSGVPCKRGHVRERYVSTGGCLGCLAQYKPERRNPYTRDKVAFMPEGLWRSKRLTLVQVYDLTLYLQRCVDAFENNCLPTLCTLCDGAQRVPRGDGTNTWKPCHKCAPEAALLDEATQAERKG